MRLYKFKVVGFLIPLLMIGFFATASVGMLYSANGKSFEGWPEKQLNLFLSLSCVAVVTAVIPTNIFYKISYATYWILLGFLAAAEILGYVAMGAQRWIKIGSFNVQPSEFMKIGVIMALSRYFSEISLERLQKTRSLLFPLLLVCLPIFIVLRQPNLGTAIIIFLVSASIFFVAGVQLWKFGLIFLACVVSVPILWQFLHSYQKQRIMTFLNPDVDLLGSGYNIAQSKTAIGSGGLYGKGFTLGTQSQLDFLPEKHTDFIFSILAEEFGFIGVIIVLTAYLILIGYAYFIALNSKSHYGRLISVGVASFIFVHIFINLGMISSLLPTVGIPLPLVSYGRSHLSATLLCLGLLMNIQNHKSRH